MNFWVLLYIVVIDNEVYDIIYGVDIVYFICFIFEDSEVNFIFVILYLFGEI